MTSGKTQSEALSKPLRERIASLYATVGRCALPGLSLEQWIDRFLKEPDPKREVEIWERADLVLERLKARRWTYPRQRRVIQTLLLIGAGAADVERRVQISRERIEALRRAYEDTQA